MAAGGWVPFKELSHVIRWALSHPEREAYFSLEEALKKHRPDFTNLLENPVSEGAEENGRESQIIIVKSCQLMSKKLYDTFVIIQSQNTLIFY